ncbi:MAG TPA: hypothetical protein VME18_08340 [Acidobacteriaceae bacterium]|nr:hypothetical protein [Acidobacteriaceae bacterium]
MRPTLLLLLLLPSLSAHAQPDVWQRVSTNYREPVLETVTNLPMARQIAVAQLIERCCDLDLDAKPGSTPVDIAQCLTFQAVPLASKQDVLFVWGCYQAVTGGGGPNWLVRFRGGMPILLASPNDDFSGWLHSIQSSVTNGYHDLLLGWHMGASETDLTYFQFNGRSYVPVSKAERLCNGDQCRIHPGAER